jgi:hypothetical protein
VAKRKSRILIEMEGIVLDEYKTSEYYYYRLTPSFRDGGVAHRIICGDRKDKARIISLGIQ